MKKCRVLLLRPHFVRNLGGPSMILGITRVLGEHMVEPEFILANSFDEEAERLAVEHSGLSHVSLRGVTDSPRRTLVSGAVAALTRRPLVGSAAIRRFIRTVQAADLVVGAEGILFADSLGRNSFRGRAFAGLLFGIAKALGKPAIQYTADFGPLETRWNRFFAKFWLNRLDAVVCRSKISHEWLTRIGVAPDKLFTAPDTGILMKPEPCQEAERLMEDCCGAPLVGIGVSHQVRNRFSNPGEYDRLIGRLARHVIQEQECRVLVVPNELRERPEVDDASIARTIVRRAADSRVSMLDTEPLSGPELKAVLGQCRAMVSSRYHSLVAGLSMASRVLRSDGTTSTRS